jgi:hypothetical protein
VWLTPFCFPTFFLILTAGLLGPNIINIIVVTSELDGNGAVGAR